MKTLNPPCSVETCNEPQVYTTRQLCRRHYANWRQFGHAESIRERSLERRIMDVGFTVTDSGCWEWKGPRHSNHGYGTISFKKRRLRVHRAMYEMIHGPLAPGLLVRHTCDNPPCANPAHLISGTAADNSRDMVERGRGKPRLDVCPNGHDRTLPGAVRVVVERICVECARRRAREYSRRKRISA